MAYRVLFVCTGNICRSPTALAFFRKAVQEAGLEDQIHADGCGTHGYHVGENPDPRTIHTAFRRGVDMADLVARKIHPNDFIRYNLILAMDNTHMIEIQKIWPREAKAKLAMYLEYADMGKNKQMPDPYYAEQHVFDQVADLVVEATGKILQKIRAEVMA